MSEAIKDPSNFVLKPPHRAPISTYSHENRTITFTLSEPTYLLLQFNDSVAHLGGLLAIFAEAKPMSPLSDPHAGYSDPGVVSVARPSPIPSLCTHFTRTGIEWRR